MSDLRKLRETGFRGLVTYAAEGGSLGLVPQLAREAGFDGAVVMGIWDPASVKEWEQAVAQQRYVDGYCVGNEGLGTRYQRDDLALRMAQLRAATGKPVTTSETIDRYLHGSDREFLLAQSDWLFPIAHPFWANHVEPGSAVAWIVARYDLLAASARRGVVLKEAGVPTAGAPGYSESAQAHFFALLEKARVVFVHFEAFDQPWKSRVFNHPAEAHWGLFRADATPKAGLAQLPRSREGS